MGRVLPNQRRRSFMLLETMIGVAIFAIGVLALARSVTNTLNAQIAKNDLERARLALSNRIAEIQAGAILVTEEAASEELGGGFEGITLEHQRRPLELENEKNEALLGLYEIKVTATWRSGGVEQSREVIFYAFNPK
jgi:type II secretory pathway pseudopilin PulG